jgi:hypothetical protein
MDGEGVVVWIRRVGDLMVLQGDQFLEEKLFSSKRHFLLGQQQDVVEEDDYTCLRLLASRFDELQHSFLDEFPPRLH